MLHRDYDSQVCSIARSLEVVGERWSLLVVRDLMLGVSRFDDLVADLGITRSVLAARLRRLEEEGIVRRERYSERPPRDAYRLTPAGVDLWPVLVSLLHWGDEHRAGDAGAPWLLRHRGCGGELGPGSRCERCAELVAPRAVERVPGPGLEARPTVDGTPHRAVA